MLSITLLLFAIVLCLMAIGMSLYSIASTLEQSAQYKKVVK